jgi:hypothetical protein
MGHGWPMWLSRLGLVLCDPYATQTATCSYSWKKDSQKHAGVAAAGAQRPLKNSTLLAKPMAVDCMDWDGR